VYQLSLDGVRWRQRHPSSQEEEPQWRSSSFRCRSSSEPYSGLSNQVVPGRAWSDPGGTRAVGGLADICASFGPLDVERTGSVCKMLVVD